MNTDTKMQLPLQIRRITDAITEAIRETEKCPEDSIQDIWNEALHSWETGLRMNHRFEVELELELIDAKPEPNH